MVEKTAKRAKTKTTAQKSSEPAKKTVRRGPKPRSSIMAEAPVTKAGQADAAKKRRPRSTVASGEYVQNVPPLARRLAEARVGMGLSQDAAAARILVAVDKPSDNQIERAKKNPKHKIIELDDGRVVVKKPMTRSGYAQYETGFTSPTIEKVWEICEGLTIDPVWLTFGIEGKGAKGRVLTFDPEKGFVEDPEAIFQLDLAWLGENAAMYYAEEFLNGISPGEAVIVDRAQIVESVPSKFLIGVDGEVRIATAHTVRNGQAIRVYGESLKEHTDYDPDALSIAGEYLGRVCRAGS